LDQLRRAGITLGGLRSLDGKSADEDNGIRDVMMSIDDPEQEEYFVSRLWDAGVFLIGRNTYEIIAGYWPTSDHPSAGAMNEIPKVMFSRTLKSAVRLGPGSSAVTRPRRSPSSRPNPARTSSPPAAPSS